MSGPVVRVLAVEEALAAEREETWGRLARAVCEGEKLAELHGDEVRRRKEEGKERLKEIWSDGGAIAVATDDISITNHCTTSFTSYTTRGRLIYDTNSLEESESGIFEIAIYHDLDLSESQVYAKTIGEMFDMGMGSTSYNFLNGLRYRCRSGVPIVRGG